jgi:hypothetical protein
MSDQLLFAAAASASARGMPRAESAPVVAVLEDDPAIRTLLQRMLGSEYQLVFVNDAAQLRQRLENAGAALVLLDILLPSDNGIAIAKSIRATSDIPLILISGLTSSEMISAGLNVGADDYVTKPFDPLVLRARLRNALRRAAPAREAPKHVVVHFAGCTCAPLARTVTHADGRNAQLTEKEVQLFMALARRAEEVVDRDELSRLLTGGEWSPLNRALDVHVSNLRRKLMSVMQADSVITSFRGIGYMLRAAARIDE